MTIQAIKEHLLLEWERWNMMNDCFLEIFVPKTPVKNCSRSFLSIPPAIVTRILIAPARKQTRPSKFFIFCEPKIYQNTKLLRPNVAMPNKIGTKSVQMFV